MRPDTGEILAVAGTPFSELQPPGSTFKIVTLTGALLAGLATPTTTYPYETSTTIDGYKLQNANGESCGGIACARLRRLLQLRIRPAWRPGSAAPASSARRSDSASTRRPPIPGVAESTIPEADVIGSALDVGSSAIGQGMVQATVLQMALIASTIAEGGQRPVPTLALGVRHAKPPCSPSRSPRPSPADGRRRRQRDRHRRPDPRRRSRRKDRNRRAEDDRGQLHARSRRIRPPAPRRRPTIPKNTDAWFVAFAPLAKPRVAVGILLDNDGAGGDTAAPLAKILLEAALKSTAFVKGSGRGRGDAGRRPGADSGRLTPTSVVARGPGLVARGRVNRRLGLRRPGGRVANRTMAGAHPRRVWGRGR